MSKEDKGQMIMWVLAPSRGRQPRGHVPSGAPSTPRTPGQWEGAPPSLLRHLLATYLTEERQIILISDVALGT